MAIGDRWTDEETGEVYEVIDVVREGHAIKIKSKLVED